MVFKVKGIIEFSPEDKTKKHASQSAWKRVAMIRTDCDMDRYYAWFLKKRFNLDLNKTLRGTHITFISDRLDKATFEQASAMFNGKEITFYVENEPRTNGTHWWLRVYSPEAESIREIMGLSREPYFGMHLTLGLAIEKYPEGIETESNILKARKDYLAHSKYIYESNILANTPRIPLSEQEIIEYDK